MIGSIGHLGYDLLLDWMNTRTLGCVTYLVLMIVQIGLEYSLCLDGGGTLGLNVCKSLQLSLGLMLIERYIRSLAIDEGDMTTHISPRSMVPNYC